MKYAIQYLFYASLLLLSNFAQAEELRLAKIFTDHAVLQREMQVPIWGWSKPDTQVTVSFADQIKSVTSDAKGYWIVRLDAMKASVESRPLVITSGTEEVKLKDILVGEVWLASGQSNMGFSIPKSTHAEEARKVIPHPHFRSFKAMPSISSKPLKDFGADGVIAPKQWSRGGTLQWRIVNNEKFSLNWMSAVAAWFAHEIRLDQGVPVGLIEAHFGGSKLLCWMPNESMAAVPEFKRDILEAYQVRKAEYDENYAKWKADPKRNPKRPPTEPWRPSSLYNAQIAPMAPLAMRGVIWYQGESNQGRAEAYRRQLPAMVRSWRKLFQKEDLSFLAVQLPAFGKVRIWHRSPFAEMRESISLLESTLPFTASVVSTDCGLPDEIHPPLKKPIGQRLALAARSITYGQDLVWSGPTLKKAVFENGKARVFFDHVGSGLVAKDGPLVGFFIAGLDQKFHEAKASIHGDTVELISEAVPEPVAVRYAWQDTPVANLWNKDGLPAGTFRSDIWPLQTQAILKTPLHLKVSGTPEKPVVFDGQGMIVDLGIDVSQHEWSRDGDLWTSSPNLLKQYDLEPRMAGQRAGLFIGEIPILIPRDFKAEKEQPNRKSWCYLPPEKLEPGQMGYQDDGALYFRWPKGIKPGITEGPRVYKKIILPPKKGTNGVSIAASHIIVKNLTVRYAANDGFNIHGHRKGVRLEHVRALSNADEGISAHGGTEMEVIDAEVAWNGSVTGGVSDVNDSETVYRNCIVHDNAGAAFYFSGKNHKVSDTHIFNQSRDFSIQSGTNFTKEKIRRD